MWWLSPAICSLNTLEIADIAPQALFCMYALHPDFDDQYET